MPEEEKTETVPMQTMPALALRGLTVYPKMMVHFDVGREASVKAIEESMSSNQPIFLVAQKDIRVEEPDRNHLFAMGTVSVVRQILRLPGKTIRVMVEGQTRARLHELTQTDPYLVAQVEPVETSEHYEGKTNSLRAEAAIRQAYELFDRYSELSPKNASAEMLMNIMSSEDAGYIADFLAQNVSMRVLDKQSILDELRPVQRLNKMNRLLRREVEILEMEQSIQRRVQENMTQNQKDAFLREQVRVIQEELGEDGDNELAAYRRAETVERQARNRAAQMYHRVNGLIADLAARMEGSKAEMTTAAEALGQALDQLQSALDGGQDVLTEGAATLRALEPEHPAEEETK